MHSQFWWVRPRGSPDWTHPTLCPLATPDRQHMTGVNHWIRWPMTECVPPCVPWWHLTACDRCQSLNQMTHDWMRPTLCPLVTPDSTWQVSITESDDPWLNASHPVSPGDTWQHVTGVNHWIRWPMTECVPPCVPWWHLTACDRCQSLNQVIQDPLPLVFLSCVFTVLPALSTLHQTHACSKSNALTANPMAFALSHTLAPTSGTISPKTSGTLLLSLPSKANSRHLSFQNISVKPHCPSLLSVCTVCVCVSVCVYVCVCVCVCIFCIVMLEPLSISLKKNLL